MSPRLFLAVASLETRQAMSYRVEFWLNSLAAPLTQFVIAYHLWRAILEESGQTTVAGYGFAGLVSYYLAAILLGRIVRGKEFQDAIAAEIYEGTLNRYLVFPVPYFPFKYAQHLGQLAPLAAQALVLAALGLAFLWPQLDQPPAPLHALSAVAMTAVVVALANLLHFLMLAPLQCVAFWADNTWSLVVAFRFATNLLGGLMIPLAMFPAAAQRVLAWLPFRFVFDVPTRTLLGQLTATQWLGELALCAAWCAVFALLTGAVWARGKQRYAGVGI